MVNLTDLQITSKIVSVAGHVTLVCCAAANAELLFCNFYSGHVRLHSAFMTAYVALAVSGHYDGQLPPIKTKIFFSS